MEQDKQGKRQEYSVAYAMKNEKCYAETTVMITKRMQWPVQQ